MDSLFSELERNIPAPGMLLLSGHDSFLDQRPREVYLLLSLDNDIATAVALGARSEIPVHEVLPEWTDAVSKPQVIYVGAEDNREFCVAVGTVRTDVAVETRPYFIRLANRMVQVDISEDPELVMEDLDGLRFFAGFRQWETGDLFAEIGSGMWFVTPALASDLLAPGNVDVWGDIMRRQDMPLPLYANYPADLEVN